MVSSHFPCLCNSYSTRARISRVLPISISIASACVANAIIPGFSASIPNWMVLLTLWMIAAIPPTSYFAAQISALALGYHSKGIPGVLIVGMLSIFGATSMIASNASLLNIRSKQSYVAVLKTVSRVFRLMSSFTMATVWSIPAPLTLVPRLMFLLYFEITVLLSYRLLHILGQGGEKPDFCDTEQFPLSSAESNTSPSNTLPIMLVHGLGGSKAQWLLGNLLLQKKMTSKMMENRSGNVKRLPASLFHQ